MAETACSRGPGCWIHAYAPVPCALLRTRAFSCRPHPPHAQSAARSGHPCLCDAGPGARCLCDPRRAVEHRADDPTHWRLHLHDGAGLLQRVVEERQGDFVVLAGRNDTKLATIASLTQAGLPVLADKPWLTDSRQLPYLAQVTTGSCVAMDLMTGAYSLRAQVMAQVVHTPELFGTFVTHEGSSTRHRAGVRASSHQTGQWSAIATARMVLRPPCPRRWGGGCPSAYGGAGAGVGARGSRGRGERDLVLASARCWPTPVPLDLFRESTGLATYPVALLPAVRDGVLQYACNSEICYRLQGIHVCQRAKWRQREPAGTGDLHRQPLRPLRGPTPPGGGNRVSPDALAPSDGRGGAGTRAGSGAAPVAGALPRARVDPGSGRAPVTAPVRARSGARKPFCPGPPCLSGSP